MLFTTAGFSAIYLPVVFVLFFLIGPRSTRLAAAWLFAASLFFYGYWMPEFTLLLVGSICWNFFVGMRIAQSGRRERSRRWLIAGIVVDLVLLAYFKYANFFVDSLSAVLGSDWELARITLPIGISFFTFTQIAFLADAYQKGVREYRFIHYGLFVTYFPHLIAGPVLHHAQMMPQFGEASTYRPALGNIAGGMAIFALGLFKKVVLADGISPYADTVFDGTAAGAVPNTVEAWVAALAYTFQLYFDFSGYSDMAIGLSWMFNIRLPYNFDSPYRALNISDFWRRWHMSLSAFLRDYLYVPLGGNRNGPSRRYVNLFVTMLLGGLWHGAAWTFVFWGGLHGLYLAINHAYRRALGHRHARVAANPAHKLAAWALTMLAAIIAWVFFRAVDFSSAAAILQGMAGINQAGTAGEAHVLLWNQGLSVERAVIWCAALSLLAFLCPNSNRIGEAIRLRCGSHPVSAALVLGAATTAVALLVLTNETRSAVSAFIYFNF